MQALHFPKVSSFDLHVLGMPPAFILSQDQTLQKKIILFSFNLSFLVLLKNRRFAQFSKNIFFPFSNFWMHDLIYQTFHTMSTFFLYFFPFFIWYIFFSGWLLNNTSFIFINQAFFCIFFVFWNVWYILLIFNTFHYTICHNCTLRCCRS